jgi:hypothetical protein
LALVAPAASADAPEEPASMPGCRGEVEQGVRHTAVKVYAGASGGKAASWFSAAKGGYVLLALDKAMSRARLYVRHGRGGDRAADMNISVAPLGEKSRAGKRRAVGAASWRSGARPQAGCPQIGVAR